MKTTKLISSIASVLTVTCLNSTAFAAPIMVDLNDFFPDPTVTVEVDGSSALIEEGANAVLLSNQPFWGDPNVIIPGANTILSFNYEFTQSLGNDDEFRVNLYDTNTYLDNPPSILDDFFLDIDDFDFSTQSTDTLSGLVSFDLSGYVGLELGLDFELRSFDGGAGLDSTVRIFDVRLDTQSVTPIPETSTTVSFLLGSVLLLVVKRWKK